MHHRQPAAKTQSISRRLHDVRERRRYLVPGAGDGERGIDFPLPRWIIRRICQHEIEALPGIKAGNLPIISPPNSNFIRETVLRHAARRHIRQIGVDFYRFDVRRPLRHQQRQDSGAGPQIEHSIPRPIFREMR